MFDLNTVEVRCTHHAAFDPAEQPGVRAITYEGMPIAGKKTKVFAYIGFPENAGGSVPGVVLVHGGGGHAFPHWVKLWVDHGYAAIAMDTTGYFPDESESGWHHGLYGEFAEDGYTDAPGNQSMQEVTDDCVEKQWMYHAVADVMLARRILAADPRVDAAKIGMTGISWGGVITSIMLGYETEFAFAIPVYGSGYLSDLTLGSIRRWFQSEPVRKLWLAEKRFDRVKTPVFWLCWNDDNNFSIQANTQSYLDTRPGNEQTILSIIDGMGHGHTLGWARPEIMAYADAILAGRAVPQVLTQPQGRAFSFDIAVEGEAEATAYYITSPMRYVKQNKYGYGEYPFMEQPWQTIPCTVSGGTVTGQLPEDAAGYYVEIRTELDGEPFVLTSGYVELA